MKRPRRRKPTAPNTLQVAYYRELKRALAYAHALVRSRLKPLLEMLAERANPHLYTDALPPGKRLNHVMEAIKATWSRTYSQQRLERIAGRVGQLVSEFNRRQLAKQLAVSEVPDKGSKKAVANFVSENVALIRTVPTQFFAEIESRIHRAMADGQRHEELAKVIEERFGVAENRAKLIARDQVLKFNGSLNMARMQAAGVERYIWRTVEDERVRGVHDEFDGNEYAWNDPPGNGSPEEGSHPGTAINCRCWADPVLTE